VEAARLRPSAWQQPNHFFHPELPDSRLQEACDFARQHGMGMELELDERLISRPKTFAPRFDAYLKPSRPTASKPPARLPITKAAAPAAPVQIRQPEVRRHYDRMAEWVLDRQRLADAMAAAGGALIARITALLCLSRACMSRRPAYSFGMSTILSGYSSTHETYQEFAIDYFQDEDGIFTARVPAIKAASLGKDAGGSSANAVDAIESCLEAREKVSALKLRKTRYAGLNIYSRPVNA